MKAEENPREENGISNRQNYPTFISPLTETARCTGYGPAWVHDGQQWLACTQMAASVKDPANARFFERDNVVYLELGLGKKSEQGTKHTYSLKAPAAELPQLPESVSLLH